MSWYWWMVLGALALMGARALWGKLREIVRPTRSCSWCARSSGFEVTGHSYEMCRGPHSERLAEEQRLADRQFEEKRRKEFAAAQAVTRAEDFARQSARLRLLQVGTITTRSTSRGDIIDVSGWQFDLSCGPNGGGASSASAENFRTTGAPEKVHGWTLQELHALAHGGACNCDVVRMAKHVRH
ncbi:hypothetical protein [Streptomyces sp. NPDC001205]